MFKIIFTFFLCLLFCQILLAQNGTPFGIGAKGQAMGGVGVAMQDVNSLWSNQAGLVGVKKLSVSMNSEQRFSLQGVNSSTLAVAIPTSKLGVVALGVQYFGGSVYQETKVGLAYARKLMDKLSIGVQFDYLRTQVEDYGNVSVYTFELGLQSQLLEKLNIGAHIYSPMRVSYTDTDYVPTQITLGLSYEFSKKVQVVAEFEQIATQKPNAKAGIAYRIAKPLSLYAGVSTNPLLNTFGLGIHLKYFRIDMAFQYHQLLGFTPSIGLKL